MAKVALLIGVSEYQGLNTLLSAIKDVEAMQRVLQDPEMGGFDQVETLLNPDDPTKIQQAIEKVFSNRTKNDLVLLFFSGHGIKDDSGNLYFATSTTNKYPNGNLIKSTAVPGRFVHDIMGSSLCKRQVVILDCCFSGAFAEGMTAKDDGVIDIEAQLGGRGRAVLTSSNSTQYSFEQKESILSVYTQHIVTGIETGAADLNKDGSISVLELHEYLCNHVEQTTDAMSPKIIGLKDEGFNIVIAKSPVKPQKWELINLGEVELKTLPPTEDNHQYEEGVIPLHNFLKPYESFIRDLIVTLANDASIKTLNNKKLTIKHEVQNRLLDIVRHLSKADCVLVLRHDTKKNTWHKKSESDFNQDINQEVYVNILKSNILAAVSEKSIFYKYHHGIYKTDQEEKVFVFIPLKSKPQTEFMVICGLPRDYRFLEDPYALILSTFYQASQELEFQPTLVEAAIIDALKKAFGFVSPSLYDRRFELFCEHLQQMIIHFQPIVRLDPHYLSIKGWEALARDPYKLTVPSELFKAAELWGTRFTVELDQYFLEKAIITYFEARKEEQLLRYDQIKPLSVNVYPDSLMRQVYFDKVSELINKFIDDDSDKDKKYKLIPADKLILEISEKAELPKIEDGSNVKLSWIDFKKRLEEYKAKLDVGFAIDDFGVGYASVSRLAGLNAPHVKIDREVLFHNHNDTETIIRFVHELALQNRTDVVVEGLDEHIPISLHRLKEIGVKYIQGYVVDKAGAKVYDRIDKDKADALIERILGK